jgi:predicted SnoaL-like aldol condensation-catalyzing enzyme
MRAALIALAFAAFAAAAPAPARAQAEPVTPAADIEALFTDPDPALHRNKQAAYHIMRELLAANHWDRAGEWLTERYIQHNPNAGSGRAAVVHYFADVLGRKPTPVPERLATPIVAVIAEGDLVVVAIARTLPHPTEPGKTYTTTWFDMWRFVDGKADEHWDGATLPAAVVR